jgi:hypothetical protein
VLSLDERYWGACIIAVTMLTRSGRIRLLNPPISRVKNYYGFNPPRRKGGGERCPSGKGTAAPHGIMRDQGHAWNARHAGGEFSLFPFFANILGYLSA